MLSLRLPQLFDIHQVPKVFREDGIMSGYRHPRSSALDCILSSFQMTNETVNIWTHFLPTWYFLWRFSVLCSSLDFLTDSYTLPLLVYMLLICLYPFTSSCAHTFSTMSAEARHICYFFDYGALSLYSLGCAVTYGSYAMPDCWVNSWLHQHFVTIGVANSLFCTSMSCYSRFVELQFPHKSKIMRTAAFVVPFLFDSFPLFYRLLSCCWGSCSPSQALASHSYHLLFAFLTCFLFASHLPERLAPGRFDYIGPIRVLLLQDVQIDGRVLDEGYEPVVDVLNDEPLLRFSLPAALHEEMHFLRAGAWPFKLSPLCDALNGLERG
uniref:Progestin and adipoQ receptor family member 6-like n=1 Tax=Sinocyclocheilus anshuiensis TaxID=1608454 RepID=A0A671L7H1_9TELE